MTRSELLQTAKPILFNTDMVRAIQDDRKTVTRRVIKLKYSNTHHEMNTDKYGTRLIEIQDDVEGETFGKNEDGTNWRKLRGYIEPKPPYKKGQYLYVRETWGDYRECKDGGCGYFLYRADYPQGAFTYEFDGHICDLPKWHPSIHMPKEAARIFLKVTDVRVERLQDITQAEAIDEGALKSKQCETHEYREAVNLAVKNGAKPPLGYTPVERFAGVWNSTIKKNDLDRYGWEANPWVWVIEFERVEVEP